MMRLEAEGRDGRRNAGESWAWEVSWFGPLSWTGQRSYKPVGRTPGTPGGDNLRFLLPSNRATARNSRHARRPDTLHPPPAKPAREGRLRRTSSVTVRRRDPLFFQFTAPLAYRYYTAALRFQAKHHLPALALSFTQPASIAACVLLSIQCLHLCPNIRLFLRRASADPSAARAGDWNSSLIRSFSGDAFSGTPCVDGAGQESVR